MEQAAGGCGPADRGSWDDAHGHFRPWAAITLDRLSHVESDRAKHTAQAVLSERLPRRWAHVQGVAALAASLCHMTSVADQMVAAAWLHDIGYARPFSEAFHPLDGARMVRGGGFSPQVAQLVAYHSCAEVEARERGLLDVLETEFTRPTRQDLALLTYCDMHVAPSGERVTLDERLRQIQLRYGPQHVVSTAMAHAQPELRRIVAQVEEWLAAAESK